MMMLHRLTLVMVLLLVPAMATPQSEQATTGQSPQAEIPDTAPAPQAQPEQSGAPADISVRTYLDEEGDIFVGQMVRFWVEILSTAPFSKAPTYPELKMDGAFSILPEPTGVNFSDKGKSGQRQRYAIVPMRPGALEIPSVELEWFTGQGGSDATSVTLHTEPLTLNAIYPAVGDDFGPIISVEKLTASETYDRAFEGLKVGDAITRTIKMQVTGTFASIIPKVEFEAVAGAQIYASEPVLDDKIDRGTYTATRQDAATYVFGSETDLSLPEISVRWWNPVAKKAEEKIFPAVDLTIAHNPDIVETPASTDPGAALGHRVVRAMVWLVDNAARIGMVLVGLWLAVVIWRAALPPTKRMWLEYQQRRKNSEGYAFQRFARACRSGDAPMAIKSFWLWADRLAPQDQAMTARQLQAIPGGAAFGELTLDVATRRHAETSAEPLVGPELLARVTAIRKSILAHKSKHNATGGQGLNPANSP